MNRSPRPVSGFAVRRLALWSCLIALAFMAPPLRAQAKPPAEAGPGANPAPAAPVPVATAPDTKTEASPAKEVPAGSSTGKSAPAAGALPWDGVQGVKGQGSLPSFLQTSDKRVRDERPPPGAAKVKALRELEQEVDRFAKLGGSYRDTVSSLVQREYVRQRQLKEQRYGKQITEEEQLEDKARTSAIEMFERFIAKYPDDPTYTPDAMFRLGELYFERQALLYQTEMAAFLEERDRRIAAGEDASGLAEPEKTFEIGRASCRERVCQYV